MHEPLLDSGNNVYVSGLDTYYYNYSGEGTSAPYVTLTTIKYGSNGSQIWKTSEAPSLANTSMQVEGAALDGASSIYVVAIETRAIE
jgi:hypothetical protein